MTAKSKDTGTAQLVSITIHRPTTNTLKSEEQMIICSLQDLVKGSGSYLESLFSQDFVSWVNGMIQNDFSPDLYGSYLAEFNAIQDNRKGHEEALNKLQADLKAAQARADQAVKLQAEIKEKADQDSLTAWERVNNLGIRLEEQRQEIMNRGETITEQAEVIRDQAAEIIRLKALLWDQGELIKKLNSR